MAEVMGVGPLIAPNEDCSKEEIPVQGHWVERSPLVL